MTTVAKLLRREAAFLRRRKLTAALAGTGLAVVTPLVLLAAVDATLPFRESAAAWLVVAWLPAAVAALIWQLWTAARRLSDAHGVAVALEQAEPDLMDSVICAAEVVDRGEQASPLAAALLRQVERRVGQIDVRQVVRRQAMGATALALLAAAAIAGLVFAGTSALADKARHHLGDTLAGRSSGLTVTPGDTDVARGDDLVIRAALHRGADRAQIVLESDQGKQVFDMYQDREQKRQFQFFSVEGPFQYTIRTPTLTSRTYRVSTFEKPTIEKALLTVNPPAYTGAKRLEFQQLTDVSVPEGGLLEIRVTANVPVSGLLRTESGVETPLRPTGDGGRELACDLTVSESFRYRLALTDRQGHTIETQASYGVECVEDLPPVIQVVMPDEGGRAAPEEMVPFAATVIDDYGVMRVSLLYSVGGGDWVGLVLHDAEGSPTAEVEAVGGVGLDGLVRVGDVVSYYFVAHDNAEPDAHEVRSTLRFLEIRADADTPMADSDGGGGGEREETLQIADLIVEQKRLLRQSFAYLTRHGDNSENPQADDDAAAERGAARRVEAEALRKAASDLRVIASKRYQQIKERVEGASFGKAEELFLEALAHMAGAANLLGREMVDGAMREQQRSLSSLVALEVELQKNARTSSQCSSGKQGKDTAQQSGQQQQNQEKQRREATEEMKRALQKLAELATRQQGQNRQVEASGASAQPGERQFMEQRQREIREETDRVRQLLRQNPEAFEVTEALRRAEESMGVAERELQRSGMTNATRQGRMAHQFLQRSHALLEQMFDAMTGNRLAQGKRMLDSLERRQRQLRTQTAEAAGDRERTRRLKDRQEQLQQSMNQLTDWLAQTAGEMEGENPSASEAIGRGLQEARENGLERAMKRAANALRYGRGERATDYQDQSLAGMERLGRSIEQAMAAQPDLSPEQLGQMLQDTLAQMQQWQDGARQPGAEHGSLLEKIRERTDERADRMRDPAMDRIAAEMSRAAESGPSAFPDTRVAALLEQTARLLEKKLLEATVKRKLDLSRIIGHQAPDGYRKLVDQYFKNLSRQGAE